MRPFSTITIGLITALMLMLPSTTAEEAIFKTVQEQMKETLDLYERSPNATPEQLASLLASSHGRGPTVNTNTIPVAKSSSLPQPTKSAGKLLEEKQTEVNKSNEPQRATASAQSSPTTPIALPATPTHPSPSSAPTTATPVPSIPVTPSIPSTPTTTAPQPSSQDGTFLFILFILSGAFIAVTWASYKKWTEINGTAALGLYQPLAQQNHDDNDDTSIDLDDVESGAIEIDHGSMYNDKTDLEALDYISTGSHLLNTQVLKERSLVELDNGFGHQQVNALPTMISQQAIVLQQKPPESIQSDNNSSLAIDTINTDTFGVWSDIESNHDVDDRFESWAISTSQEFDLTTLAQPSKSSSPSSSSPPQNPPQINSDSVSLGMMLGANYSGADSRVTAKKSLPANTIISPLSATNTSASPVSTSTLQTDSSVIPKKLPSPSHPKVIMKGPTTNQIDEPKARLLPAMGQTLISGSSQKFTTFTPLVVDQNTFNHLSQNQTPHPLHDKLRLPLTQQEQQATVSAFDDAEDLMFGPNYTPDAPFNHFNLHSFEPTETPLQIHQQVRQDGISNSPIIAASDVKIDGNNRSDNSQPQLDPFQFDGACADDDDWFQDIPDTSTAMDLLQKSNDLISDLNL